MTGSTLLMVACRPESLSDLGRLVQVIGQFLGLSLFSLGGGNTDRKSVV